MVKKCLRMILSNGKGEKVILKEKEMWEGKDERILEIKKIEEIVMRLKKRKRMVGNIIGRKEMLGGKKMSLIIERGWKVRIRSGEIERIKEIIEMSELIDGKMVERKMVGRKEDRIIKLIEKGIDCMVRKKIDKVEGKERENIEWKKDRGIWIWKRMNKEKEEKIGIVKRMNKKRKKVKEWRKIEEKKVGIKDCRIGLKSKLNVRRKRKIRWDEIKKREKGLRMNKRWCEEEKENDGEGERECEIKKGLNIEKERREIERMIKRIVEEMDVEIEIREFGKKERKVKINEKGGLKIRMNEGIGDGRIFGMKRGKKIVNYEGEDKKLSEF